jgi:hypothetical protein
MTADPKTFAWQSVRDDVEPEAERVFGGHKLANGRGDVGGVLLPFEDFGFRRLQLGCVGNPPRFEITLQAFRAELTDSTNGIGGLAVRLSHKGSVQQFAQLALRRECGEKNRQQLDLPDFVGADLAFDRCRYSNHFHHPFE